ncbi:helix-turn-helix transcriptional regulator [Lysinibacillus xylanilyticus]|uniref:helix-turn-helix transcriptional regulator n=1 Tax=Lysinibacillus xylanilyticus TaxID=582475 RepID=UPI003CFE7F4B
MVNKLREKRLEKGISQVFISKKLGYKTPSWYANIEAGRNKISLENAKKIAEILEVPIEEISFTEKLHETCNLEG